MQCGCPIDSHTHPVCRRHAARFPSAFCAVSLPLPLPPSIIAAKAKHHRWSCEGCCTSELSVTCLVAPASQTSRGSSPTAVDKVGRLLPCRCDSCLQNQHDDILEWVAHHKAVGAGATAPPLLLPTCARTRVRCTCTRTHICISTVVYNQMHVCLVILQARTL